MSSEGKIKQAWKTPEIIDLDMDKTSGKAVFRGESSTSGWVLPDVGI